MRSVNLIPVRVQRRQQRSARLQLWITTNLCLLAAATAITVHQRLVLRGQAQVDAQARTQLQFDSAELTRRLLAQGQERERLVGLARVAIALDDESHLADRLRSILAAMPDQIALSSLTVQCQEVTPTPKTPGANVPAKPGKAPSAPAAPVDVLMVELRGVALDYESINSLIARVEQSNQTLRSELREATTTQLLDGHALTFLYDFAFTGGTQ